jgi:hypothetical protein
MASEPAHAKTLIVDTTSYSGNFERELFAYATGQQGCHGRADDLAASVVGDVRHLRWWGANVARRPNKHGNLQPVAIHPTPGWFNNGMGGHYRDLPVNYGAALADAVSSMRKSHEKQTAMIKDRLNREDFEDGPTGWTREACLRQLESNDAAVRTVERVGRRYDAYLSVAIYVREFPRADVLEEFTSRVRYFARHHESLCRFTGQGEIGITGFRLLATPQSASPSPA